MRPRQHLHKECVRTTLYNRMTGALRIVYQISVRIARGSAKIRSYLDGNFSGERRENRAAALHACLWDGFFVFQRE